MWRVCFQWLLFRHARYFLGRLASSAVQSRRFSRAAGYGIAGRLLHLVHSLLLVSRIHWYSGLLSAGNCCLFGPLFVRIMLCHFLSVRARHLHRSFWFCFSLRAMRALVFPSARLPSVGLLFFLVLYGSCPFAFCLLCSPPAPHIQFIRNCWSS